MSKPTGESKITNLVRAVQMAKGNDEIITELGEMIRYQSIRAKLIRAKYLALVESGFTSEQALQLCNDL